MKQIALLLIVISIFFLPSCKTGGLIGKIPTSDTSSNNSLVINNRFDIDTITIPADTSAFMQALFECDSNSQVIITKLISQIGQRSAIGVNTFTENKKTLVFTAKCKCDSAAIYHVMKSSDTTSKSQVVITNRIPYPVPAENTWWEKFKISYGGYAMGAWLLVIVIFILWLAWKIFKIATPQGAAISAAQTGLGWLTKLFR